MGRGVHPNKHDHMVKLLTKQPDLSVTFVANLSGVSRDYVRKHRKLLETASA